jgi:hypothetical protein
MSRWAAWGEIAGCAVTADAGYGALERTRRRGTVDRDTRCLMRGVDHVDEGTAGQAWIGGHEESKPSVIVTS